MLPWCKTALVGIYGSVLHHQGCSGNKGQAGVAFPSGYGCYGVEQGAGKNDSTPRRGRKLLEAEFWKEQSAAVKVTVEVDGNCKLPVCGGRNSIVSMRAKKTLIFRMVCADEQALHPACLKAEYF